tara:strand:+ start:621 stop:1313 length:693 start_codon:yes stop_codon:yes gene_type:complete
MAEEQTAPVEQETSPVENQAIQKELEAMRKKNAELLDEYKKAKEQAKAIPPNVNIQELIDFKNNAEQAELESQGKYTEARTKLEEQYREKSSEDKKRIAELESKVRELELISPAVSALAEVVHDPNLVLNNYIPKDKIEVDNGVPVVVDGYERTPIVDWTKKQLGEKANYLLKQTAPQGGGAPAGRSSNAEVPAGMKNPFAPDSFNITEQMRLYRTDKDLYDRLQSQAKR